jgi:hypothetical protein
MKSAPDIERVVLSAVKQKNLEKEMIEPLAEVIMAARSEIAPDPGLRFKSH